MKQNCRFRSTLQDRVLPHGPQHHPGGPGHRQQVQGGLRPLLGGERRLRGEQRRLRRLPRDPQRRLPHRAPEGRGAIPAGGPLPPGPGHGERDPAGSKVYVFLC